MMNIYESINEASQEKLKTATDNTSIIIILNVPIHMLLAI